jgi:DNA polymerase (family 10)
MSNEAEGLDRLAIARALLEIGARLGLAGEPTQRARAYERAARALERLAWNLDDLVRERRLTDVPHVGPALAAVITELHRTGRSALLERLRAEQPPGALELSRVPLLGLPRIATLHRELGVDSLPALQAAAEAGRLRDLHGFGERTERRILESLEETGPRPGALLLPDAEDLAERLRANLAAVPDAEVAVAGALRRTVELTSELVLVAAAPRPEPVIEQLLRFPQVAGIAARAAGGCAVTLTDGLPVALHVVAPGELAAALHHHTGSAAHLAQLDELAAARGLARGPEGLRRVAGCARGPIALDDEAALYRALGLPFIPPELRAGEGEVVAAQAGTLPIDLVAPGDLRGAVHCHTVYSDGSGTIEAMARAAEALGLEYLTITDHSPAAHYAGGLTIDRLRAQWDEIAAVQERVSIRLLRGTECDILADGALDYPDAILEQLDVVIASVHARHKMDEERMTQRLLRAMAQPVFKIWGHAQGRMLPSRPPFACRMEEILDRIAESRAAVEINGDPRRLDMMPRWIRAARERGIPFAISSDAHSVGGLANARLGVAMARRGWVRRAEVLNTLPLARFRRTVRP